jgi:hypothetical protein
MLMIYVNIIINKQPNPGMFDMLVFEPTEMTRESRYMTLYQASFKAYNQQRKVEGHVRIPT